MSPSGQHRLLAQEHPSADVSSDASKNQRRVRAAKAKRVVHDRPQLAFLCVMRDEVQPLRFLDGLIQVDGGRHNAGEQRLDAQHGFECSGGAQKVARHRFGAGYG